MGDPSVPLEEAMDIGTINRLLHETVHSDKNLAMNLLQPSSPRRDQSRSNTLEEPQVHPSDMDTIYFKAVTLLADIEMKKRSSEISSTARKLCTEQHNIMSAHETVNRHVQIASACRASMECLDRNEFEAAVNYAHILQSSQDLSSASKTVKPSVKEIGTLDFDMSAQLCIEAVITRLKEKLDDAMVLRDNTSVLRFAKLIQRLGFAEEGLKSISQDVVMRASARLGSEKQLKLQIFGLLEVLFNFFEFNWKEIVGSFGCGALYFLMSSIHEASENQIETILTTHFEEEGSRDQDDLLKSERREIKHFSDNELIVVEFVEIVTRLTDYRSYIGDLLRDVDEGNKERGTNEIQQIKTSSVFLNFLTNLQTKYAIVEVSLFAMNMNILRDMNKKKMDKNQLTEFVDDFFFLSMSSINRAVKIGNIESIEKLLVVFNDASSVFDDFLNELSGSTLDTTALKILALHLYRVNLLNLMAFCESYVQKKHHKILLDFLREMEISTRFRDKLDELKAFYVEGLFVDINPVFDILAKIDFEIDEARYAEYLDEETWANTLLRIVEKVFSSARSEERSVADLIEHDFAVLIASKLQETILNCLKFSQLGAIQIEKEIRLVLLSLSMLLPGAKVRELFSRVLTIAALLNTETSEDSSYVDAASLFLPFELERIAMLRTDF